MSPTVSSREARTQSWRVLALVPLSASYFFQSSAHNESARFDQIRSVSEHGEWFIDRFSGNSGDVVQADGHTYPNKAPGTTLLGLVPWRAWQITFGSQRGLFYANPWLIAILVTPFLIFRTKDLRGPFVLSMAVVVAFLTFNAGFGDSIIYWGGAFSFGPRHLLVALPFAALLVALAIRERPLMPVIGLLMAGTILLMLPPTAVDPRLPYEPRDPYFGFYFPLYSRGLLSAYPRSTFEASPFVDSSGAFNVGRVMGLPQRLEVLPLTILWAAAVFLLFPATDQRARRTRGVIAAFVIGVGLWPTLSASSPLYGRTSGMCRLISPNRRWGYFSDYGLQPEPAQLPSRRLVPAPSITPGEQHDAFDSGALASVAVTFSGDYNPPESGWYVFQLETVGHAALYVDGMRRLRIDDPYKEKKAV